MKEKLREYALVAEILGGLAIVLSLVFVGFQLKQTNQLNRANTYLQIMGSLNQASAEIRSIESTSEAWDDFTDNRNAGNFDAEYSAAQEREIRFALGQIFRLYDAAFYAHEYSMIGEVEWRRMERNICRTSNGIERFWDTWIKRGLSEGFVNFVESECIRAGGE